MTQVKEVEFLLMVAERTCCQNEQTVIHIDLQITSLLFNLQLQGYGICMVEISSNTHTRARHQVLTTCHAMIIVMAVLV